MRRRLGRTGLRWTTLAALGLTGLLPARSEAADLVSVTPNGTSGDAPTGTPDSKLASVTANSMTFAIPFESAASDFVAGNKDVNGFPDIYISKGIGMAPELLSIGTNGLAGCGAIMGCTEGGSYAPVAPRSSATNPIVVFLSDAENLTAGFLPANSNAQTQVFSRNTSTNTTVLVTKSAASASKGAVGNASQLSISGTGSVVAFTWSNFPVYNLAGLAGQTDVNGDSDIIVWKPATPNTVIAASVRDSVATEMGNSGSSNPRVSSNGSCVVFESTANNLDGTFPNFIQQIYLRDLTTNDTILVSRKPGGGGGNAGSSNATPNADCSAVVFETMATDLFSGVSDTNGSSDVAVWIRSMNQVVPLSVNTAGTNTGNSGSTKPVLGVGTTMANLKVAFQSDANNLVVGDTNYTDVFLWTQGLVPGSGTLELVSAHYDGSGASAGGYEPTLDAGALHIAFTSNADDLLEGFSGNNKMNVWMRPLPLLAQQQPELASSAFDGSGGGNDYSFAPKLTARGLLFESEATNLTPQNVDGNAASDVFLAREANITVSAPMSVAEDGGTLSVLLTRTGNIDETVTVRLASSDPSMGSAATKDVDFQLPMDVTFQPTELTKNVSVTILQDLLVEGDEQFVLRGRVMSGYASIDPETTVTITDDDSDVDNDGVEDQSDNCPMTANSDQLDTDADSIGNVCDTLEGLCNNGVDDDNDGMVDCMDADCSADITCGMMGMQDADGDGVINANDNCPDISNATQDDTDGDNIGNACDTHEDACGNTLDDDGDNAIDCDDPDCATDIVCAAPDGDDDTDGVMNGVDNCPLVANPLQEDTDGDGIGDVCDNVEGLCNDAKDNDNDMLVDCDDPDCMNDSQCANPQGDDDMDGVANADDNCPFVANDDQMDTDGDGVGNVCDTQEDSCNNGLDDDGDGDIDCADANCASDVVCSDPTGDADGDGAANNADNCPVDSNPDQADADEDGIGDVCDSTPEPPKPPPSNDPGEEEGCGCTTVGSDSTGWGSMMAAGVMTGWWVARRRRRCMKA